MLIEIFIALNALLVVCTFAPRLNVDHWLVRVLDFPRLQFATTAVVLLVVQALLLDLAGWMTWCLLAVSAICLVVQARWILPYTRFHPTEVEAAANVSPTRTFTLLGVNVLGTNRCSRPLLEMIREHRPDFIAAVETDEWWQSELDTLEGYPYRLANPLDNLYGMNVYSRLPLEDSSIQFLVQKNVPSMHTCIVLPSGQHIELHCTHPAPPSPTENDESTERDAELVMIGRSVVHSSKPVIVTGDLNDVAWSRTTRLFRKVSGLLDPRIGRGMFNTFHARWPFLRWPLDHLFHSSHFSLVKFKRLSYFGSDHLPILVTLALNCPDGDQESFTERTEEDKRLAEQKLKSENVSGQDVHRPEPE